ncbi:AAA domain-containing protein [Bacillus sp. BGMRC 2118]|nr:AAA domain-containing protein [Bacillus sp. BGMRC 2118]
MMTEDTMLIKINKSYNYGMSAKELYKATSISWVISESKLNEGNIKYYCAVFQNKIIEIYNLDSFEPDPNVGKESRFILHGHITVDSKIRELIGLDVSKIHKGKGNPIKYTTIDSLLTLINNNSTGYTSTEKEKVEIADDSVDYTTKKELVDHINSYIKSKGFYYEKEELINLYLSIKTKPFVIISGISGTGKTKVIQWFAESVGANERNGRYTLIPVRPDWSDGSDLIGYRDIKGDFKDGPLTKVIRRAKQEPDKPFFVLLDEMNLARVEYYFSDLLSVMESRDWERGGITSSLILSEEEAGEDIWFPENLYILGTVNMDETTHPFSKKVLDRANTIEFNRVQLDYLDFLRDTFTEVSHKNIENKMFRSEFLYLKDLATANMSLVEEVSSQLITVNTCLQPIGAQVGYRVRDEICMYVAYNQSGRLLTKEQAFDNCILQKILPRISGSDSRVKRTLTELFRFLTNKVVELDIENYEQDIQLSKYPKSTAKVYEMLRRLEDDNFTSFWIS